MAREVVVVARVAQALWAETGGEAGGGILIGGDQLAQAVEGFGDGGGIGVEGKRLATAEADQFEPGDGARGQVLEAPGGEDGGFQR